MIHYYAGTWNGHRIEIEATQNEKLIVDGKVLVETKPGIHFGVALTAPMPETDGLSIYAMIDGHDCSCIVGKPLPTEYDKKSKAYTAEYCGHKLAFFNKLHSYMTVDEEEADRQDGVLSGFFILGSQPYDEKKRFMLIADGQSGGLKLKCDFYAEAENVILYPYSKQGGELIPLTDEEFLADQANDDNDDAALIAALATTISGIN